MMSGRMASLVLLAVGMTLLNCIKPIALDDSVYYYYAAHIADHPLDPYGFALHGGGSANLTLAPPVLLYWWAAAIRLFGNSFFLWKLWLLPFSVLFVFSLEALARRFTGRLAWPLTCMIALSPTFLPSLNLMLDVPALALSLVALVLFFRATDFGSWSLAIGAGLVTGLAMETKYTAFVVPAVIVVYSILYRKIHLGMVAAILAGLVFLSWEGWIASTYGESHFVCAFRDRCVPLWKKIDLCLPLLGNLGSTAPAGICLGLAALRFRGRIVAAAAGLILMGFLLEALVPESLTTLVANAHTGQPYLTLDNLIFGGLGAGLAVSMVVILWKSCRLSYPRKWAAGNWRRWRVDIFLALWLGLEVGGYFALTPYPAVRRLMGIMVIGTILGGRLAWRTCRSPDRMRLVWGATALSAFLGLVCFFVEFCHYDGEKCLIEGAAKIIRQQDPLAGLWYFNNDGFGAFEFYGQRLGMQRYFPAHSQPKSGDWIVGLEKCPNVATAALPVGPWTAVTTLKLSAPIPLVSHYQIGRTALAHHEGSLFQATIYHFCPDSSFRESPVIPIKPAVDKQ